MDMDGNCEYYKLETSKLNVNLMNYFPYVSYHNLCSDF